MKGRIITLGSFDGVHLGHQALLDRAVQEAKKRHLPTLAITFKTPPRWVLNPHLSLGLLSTLPEKKWLLEKFGIDEVEILSFDKKLSRLPAFLFLRNELINKRKARGLVVGSDFRFGVGRSAGVVELVRWGQEFEIPVWVIPPVKQNRQTVSSTLIREGLRKGRFQSSLGFLGHPYIVQGKVVRGQALGSKIGFPTANIDISPQKIVPQGVFLVRSDINRKTHYGVCNIGYRPTVSKKKKLTVEVHFLKTPPPIQGRGLLVELLSRIRSEKRFKSIPKLIQAIRRDIDRAKSMISVHSRAK